MSTVADADATAERARVRGTAAAVVATTVWASAAVIGKAIDAPVLVLLAWRHLFATVALLAFARLRGHRFTRVDLVRSAPGGLLFAVHVTLFFAALQHTSVAVVVIIYALAPLLVIPLAAWGFGERPPPVVWLLALVSVGGVAMVVSGGSGADDRAPLGIALSVLNVFGWVAFSLASKHARTRAVPTLTWMLAAHLGAFSLTLVGALVHGDPLGAVEGADWVRIVALGLLPGLLGHALMTWAYHSIDLSLASVIAVGEPVLSALGAAVFLGEHLEARQFAGIVVVCVAVALVALVSARRTPPLASGVQPRRTRQ